MLQRLQDFPPFPPTCSAAMSDQQAPSAAPPATPPAGDWSLRVLALVPLLGIVLLWSNHHLGLGAGHPALLASVAAVLPFALAVLNQLLDKEELSALQKRLRQAISRWLSWRMLLAAYLVAGAVTLTWTSIVVLAEDGNRLGRVTLQALDDASALPEVVAPEAKGEPARFVLASHPFGRPFRLTVDGFVPTVVEVYPPAGLRVRPGIDLRRSPSVLLRFSGIAQGTWRDVGGGELRIVAIDQAGAEQLLASVKDPVGALLFGRGQPVPATWQTHWQIELLARGVTNQTLAAQHLVDWKQPKVLTPAVGLEPGMTLRASLANAQKRVFARAEFVLGRDEMQDQSMEDVE